MLLEKTLDGYCQLINDKLDQLIPENETPYRNLYEAARYSLMSPAKRLRPILTLATVETLGGSLELALDPACAIEMIHTYSLIHDDLPCMDDDDLRRGKPTLHHVYPESHAVLAGDFLLTHAFYVLGNAKALGPETKVELTLVLSEAAGGSGIIGGQVMDLEAENQKIELDQLNLIHQKKTGSLISASVEFGAILGGASEYHRQQLLQYAKNIGLAFQVIDDILDVTASSKQLGKRAGSDQANHKSTYVSLIGINQAKSIADQLLESSLKILKPLPFETTLLEDLALLVVNRGH